MDTGSGGGCNEDGGAGLTYEGDDYVTKAWPMKTLLVSPQAGMCNRFRVLCSAILLARLSGRKLYHCWEKEKPYARDMEHIRHMRDSSFGSFFEQDMAIPFRAVDASTRIDEVFSECGPGDLWYEVQSSAMQRCGWDAKVQIVHGSADVLLASQADTVLLETSLCLQPSSLAPDEFEQALHDIYTQHFNPLPVYEDVIDRLPVPYVGIHIRRGDHLRYIPDAAISAENWSDLIRNYVDIAQALYIASDDEAFAATLTGLLPEYRVAPADKTFAHVPKFQAFIEFLALSRAVRIYGTVGSSFSREAARFGGCPFTLCSVKPPANIWSKVLRCCGFFSQRYECRDVPGAGRA